VWIASRSLSSGAHSRDPVARNDGEEALMSLTPRFHRLAVNDMRREAPDAVSLTFAIPAELANG
jgi:hypothetical protein